MLLEIFFSGLWLVTCLLLFKRIEDVKRLKVILMFYKEKNNLLKEKIMEMKNEK